MPIKQSLKSVRQKRGNTRILTQVMSQVVAPLHYQCFRSKVDCKATEKKLVAPHLFTPLRTTTCYEGYPWASDIPSTNRHCYYADGSPREPVVRFRDPQRIYIIYSMHDYIASGRCIIICRVIST